MVYGSSKNNPGGTGSSFGTHKINQRANDNNAKIRQDIERSEANARYVDEKHRVSQQALQIKNPSQSQAYAKLDEQNNIHLLNDKDRHTLMDGGGHTSNNARNSFEENKNKDLSRKNAYKNAAGTSHSSHSKGIHESYSDRFKGPKDTSRPKTSEWDLSNTGHHTGRDSNTSGGSSSGWHEHKPGKPSY